MKWANNGSQIQPMAGLKNQNKMQFFRNITLWTNEAEGVLENSSSYF